MSSLTYLRECQNPSRWHSFRMLSRTSPSSVLLKLLMNMTPPPVEMVHSHISTIHPTTISSSMHVLGMMPLKHQHLLKREMYMLMLVPRISFTEEPHKTQFSQDIDTLHHQMIFIRYIRPNIAESPHTIIWVPEGSFQNSNPLYTQETF